MTDKEAWVRFVSGAMGHPNGGDADFIAYAADEMLTEMRKRHLEDDDGVVLVDFAGGLVRSERGGIRVSVEPPPAEVTSRKEGADDIWAAIDDYTLACGGKPSSAAMPQVERLNRWIAKFNEAEDKVWELEGRLEAAVAAVNAAKESS